MKESRKNYFPSILEIGEKSGVEDINFITKPLITAAILGFHVTS
jgi:hypothetical protein